MSEMRPGLPEDLELLPPGPELAAAVASVDRRALSGKDRVRLLQARHRLAAHVQGELYADMHAVSQAEPAQEPGVVPIEDPEDPYPWASTEISFALRWTHTAATIRLDQARRMVEDLPSVQAALAAGLIDVPKALVLCDTADMLELPVARRIVDKLVAKAPELTTGQLRARLRRLVIAAAPQAARKRAAEEVKRRRVEIGPEPNNLASISGYDLLPHRVAAGYERLNAIARAAKAAGDPRRIDELRADAMLDLLIGEGIATGGPITDGGLDEPADQTTVDLAMATRTGGAATGDVGTTEPEPGPVAEPADWDTPWPTAPADPSLLETDPEPPPPAAPANVDDLDVPTEPAADQATGDPTVDPEDEELRPYWLADFDRLATTHPGACPHCRQPTTATERGPMPSPRRGVIDMQVSLSTLLHLDDLPAELAGYGPLLADIARQLVQQRPDLQLRFSVYNELDALLVHGTTKIRPQPPPPVRRTKRRPTAKVAAYVRARNRTCVAPGCRRPSSSCELDHTIAWTEHGESEPDNLDPACTRHHRYKHSPGCQLIHFSSGVFGWQTPLGVQHMSRPDPPLYVDADIVEPCQPG